MVKSVDWAFRTAARNASHSWVSALEPEDVVQELWAWYLERPYVIRRFDEMDRTEALKYATKQANNIYSADVKASYIASGSVTYSSDAVKAALKGTSEHWDLERLLPLGMDALRRRYIEFADALEGRYRDNKVPATNAESQVLKRAHQAITEEINQIHRDELVAWDKNKLKADRELDPDLRQQQGDTGDPTGNIALTLMDNPEEREAFYAPDDFQCDSKVIPVVTELGEATQRVFTQRYVPTAEDAAPWLNIFDSVFQAMPRLDLYRANVYPDLYPHERITNPSRWLDNDPDKEVFSG